MGKSKSTSGAIRSLWLSHASVEAVDLHLQELEETHGLRVSRSSLVDHLITLWSDHSGVHPALTSSENQTWETPESILDLARQVFRGAIYLDPSQWRSARIPPLSETWRSRWEAMKSEYGFSLGTSRYLTENTSLSTFHS